MKCLIEFCTNQNPRVRGLCNNHYNWFREQIRREKYTWEDIEKLGLCLPIQKEKMGGARKKMEELIQKKMDEYGK